LGRVDDWLLFLHVLSAFALVGTVVIFSAFALGAATELRVLAVGNFLWAVGGLGTLVFGIWLAIDLDGYEIWDGWIVTAILLWAIATELGRRAQLGYTALGEANESSTVPVAQRAALMHWLRAAFVLALLVVMVYKPGA
jgi:hypothetical protein